MKVEYIPFPHAIIDNAFDVSLVRTAVSEWPASGSPLWHAIYDEEYHRKRACNHWEKFPPSCKRLLSEMLFLDVSPFNLNPLIPDVSLWGGGMQEMNRGSRLGLHLDASHHILYGLARKLNAILFLSEWEPLWRGELQLWSELDGDDKEMVKSIPPVQNRLVLFAASDISWHSVNTVYCPSSTSRKSLACWWYGPPDSNKSRSRAQFIL